MDGILDVLADYDLERQHMRTFTAFNREFEYYPELGERTVEIPLAFAVCSGWANVSIIEVGYVVSRQIDDRKLFKPRPDRVIDLFDSSSKCEHVDAGTVYYSGSCVISISTLEHFDMPDHGNTDVGGHRGRDCLLKILKESTGYFITWPLGYNKNFDTDVREAGVEVFMMGQINGPTNEAPDVKPEWIQMQLNNWDIEYGKPFHYGNCIAIVTNVPWIMNHEIIHRCA